MWFTFAAAGKKFCLDMSFIVLLAFLWPRSCLERCFDLGWPIVQHSGWCSSWEMTVWKNGVLLLLVVLLSLLGVLFLLVVLHLHDQWSSTPPPLRPAFLVLLTI